MLMFFVHFKAPLQSRLSSGLDFLWQHMLLPHEFFSALYHQHRPKFHSVFSTVDCERFWSKMPAARLRAHPLYSDQRKMTTVPLRLFGDDAPVCTTVSCLTLLMCAAHGFRQPVTSSRIPICITPMKFCDVATFRAIYRVVVWSFLALASRYWPQTDPDGKPWPEGSFRALKAAANERLADEYTGLSWEVSGDWKWSWHAFEMPWYYN